MNVKKYGKRIITLTKFQALDSLKLLGLRNKKFVTKKDLCKVKFKATQI